MAGAAPAGRAGTAVPGCAPRAAIAASRAASSRSRCWNPRFTTRAVPARAAASTPSVATSATTTNTASLARMVIGIGRLPLRWGLGIFAIPPETVKRRLASRRRRPSAFMYKRLVAKTTSAERVARLRAIPLFSGLSDGSLGRIGAVMTEFEAAPGQVLIQQAQPGSGLLVVEEGTVVVEGPGKPPVELGPGEFLGELALLTPEGTHTARVRGNSSAVLLSVGRSDFAPLVEEDPNIALTLLSVLAGRLSLTSHAA